ncbi:MAG: hypothetical protein ABIM29_00010 [candidate division WOR-3 bacterium]
MGVIILIFGWIKMMVNPGPAEGTGIVVDTYGHPHIFYYKNNAIYHSFWNGGWYEEYVAPAASYHNSGPSVIIDSQNRIYLTYYNQNERLGYAWFDGTWHTETIDTTYRTGDYSSLKFDLTGKPCVAYYRYTGLFSGYLRYAYKSGNWIIFENSSFSSGFHANLQINSQNIPCISHCSSWSGGDLYYSQFDGQNWIHETIVQNYASGYNSLVLDLQGIPNICFYWANGSANQFDLRFTQKEGNNWVIYVVDAGQQLFKRGWDCRMAMTNNGLMNIVYHAHNEELLKYARGDANSWTIQILDTIGGYSAFTSITVQGNDVFMSYCKELQNNSVWIVSTRDFTKIEESKNSKLKYDETGIFDITGRKGSIKTKGIYIIKEREKLKKILKIF